MSATAATAVAVGATPFMANAVSSQTYFIGFPSWLPIGESNTLPSDPTAIADAIISAHDQNPLVGWGTDGVELNPRWVQWYTPLADQSYTPAANLPTGTYTEKEVTNPAYSAVYDPAYQAARKAAADADRAKLLNSNKLRDILSPEAWNALPSWVRTLNPNNPLKNNTAAVDSLIATGGQYPITVRNPFNGQNITVYTVDLSSAFTSWDAAGKTAGDAAVAAAEAQTGQPIPKTVIERTPDYAWVPGRWTTTTSGQWISPTNDVTQLTDLDLSDPSNILGNLGKMPVRDIVYYTSGDQGFLAPYMNWTAYLTNVNLVAYGDGATAAGQAYSQILQSVEDGTYPVGEPRTDARYITIIREPGEDGVTTVQTVTVDPTLFPTLPPTSGFQYPDPGNPPQFIKTPGGVVDLTVLSLVLLRNPGRPNGGLYARFAPIYEQLTGANPVTPERQDVNLPEGLDPEVVAKLINGDTSGLNVDDLKDVVDLLESVNGKPMIVTLKADATWEYDLLSDAPATANPVSWANSVASSIFLTNLLTGINPANPETAPEGTVLKAYVVPTDDPDAGSIYITYAPNQLPLLAPLRLPTQLLSLASGQDINNPVADAVEPALKMLVDLGYTDVVRNADGTYSRTLDQMHLYTPFGSKAPLTPQGLLYVPGDFITLLGNGVGTETNQELEQIATQVLSQISPNTPLEPNVKKLLDGPGDTIVAVSRGAGDATSAVLTTAGKPVIDNGPDVAGPASQLAQGTLPQNVHQALTQAIQSAPKGNLPQPYQVQQQVQDQVSSLQERLSSTEGPKLNVLTQNGNSATGAQTSTPARNSASNGQRPLQNAVNNLRSSVKNAVDGVRSAVTNGGKPSTGTTSSTSNDGSGE